jgi:hypothetical protein
MAEHPAQKAGWRSNLAARVWPWVALAWAIPVLLHVLLINILDLHWLLSRLLFAASAIAPLVAWWARGRGREPWAGFLTLMWLWLAVLEFLVLGGVNVDTAGIVFYLLFIFSLVTYWPLWAWFYRLRKLPSRSIGAADKLSMGIFLATGTPGIAASLGGLDAVTLALAFLIACYLTAALVVVGTKGPAWVQEELKDMLPWAVPWVRPYTEPSVIIAVAFGGIALVFLTTDIPVLSPLDPTVPAGLGDIAIREVVIFGLVFSYMGVLAVLQWFLLRPSQQGTTLEESD